MEYTDIKNTDHPLFSQAWRLYKKSFPTEERRQLHTQKKTMNNPLYHFELVTDKSLFIGFVLWWRFDNLIYIEHLATCNHIRGKGYGRRIIERFVSESNIPVLLEVEHPANSINIRRIGFYQRAGFVLNSQNYKHPPYKKGGEYVPLMLMTYPGAITENMLNYFLKECHPFIHEFVLNPNRKKQE